MPERAFWGLLPIFMESEIACTPFIVWFLTCFMPSVLRFHIMGYWHSRLDFVSKLIWNCPPSSKLIDSNMKCGLCGFIFTPTLCALFLFSIFPCFWYLFMECIIILISARGNKEFQRIYLQWWMGYMLLYENCRQESVFSERGSWGYREEIFWEEGLRSRWGEKKFDPLHSGSSTMISIMSEASHAYHTQFSFVVKCVLVLFLFPLLFSSVFWLAMRDVYTISGEDFL